MQWDRNIYIYYISPDNVLCQTAAFMKILKLLNLSLFHVNIDIICICRFDGKQPTSWSTVSQDIA